MNTKILEKIGELKLIIFEEKNVKDFQDKYLIFYSAILDTIKECEAIIVDKIHLSMILNELDSSDESKIVRVHTVCSRLIEDMNRCFFTINPKSLLITQKEAGKFEDFYLKIDNINMNKVSNVISNIVSMLAY